VVSAVNCIGMINLNLNDGFDNRSGIYLESNRIWPGRRWLLVCPAMRNCREGCGFRSQ
jgi:hypothetical protein